VTRQVTAPPQPPGIQPPAAHGYRGDIDGLRCIAVLAVVFYHANLPGFSGGFTGVDIFFVISGFLITSMVLQAQLTNQFRLRRFYVRRARRLFPALLAVLATSALLGWFLLLPDELEDFGESLATALAFSSNILFWSEAGYFEGPSHFKPLLHTWSLAVEEQYYLIFPLMLIALAAICGRGTNRPLTAERFFWPLLGLTLPLFLLSLGLSQWSLGRSSAAAFFLLPQRFFELLIGSIVAIVLTLRPALAEQQHPALTRVIAIVGVLMIGYAVFGFDKTTRFPGFSALIPCMGTALVICAGTLSPQSTRWLSLRPLTFVGLISYSLYLWHWPILVYLEHYLVRPPEALDTAFALTAAFVMAYLSWRFIERPFRAHMPARPEPILADKKLLPAYAAIAFAGIAGGLAMDQTNGFPARLPEAVRGIANYIDDKPPGRKRCSNFMAADVNANNLCRIGDSATRPDFVVWGDSHAIMLIPEFAQAGQKLGRTGLNATTNGCGPLLGAQRPRSDPTGDCPAFNRAVFEIIQQSPKIKTVVLHARWPIYAEGTRYKYESGEPLGLVSTSPENPDHGASNSLVGNRHAFEQTLRRTVTSLQALNKQVVILAGVPETGWATPNVLAKGVWRNRSVAIAPTADEYRARQRFVVSLLTDLQEEGVVVYWPADRLCENELCRISTIDKKAYPLPLYIDEDHLSSLGAAELRQQIEATLTH